MCLIQLLNFTFQNAFTRIFVCFSGDVYICFYSLIFYVIKVAIKQLLNEEYSLS